MIEAFKKRQHILIGAFAQGRMQEILNRLKIMKESGIIPKEYEICADGKLGIKTCRIYQSVFRQYYPESVDFLPKHFTCLDSQSRKEILDDGFGPKIIVTTSGMLSNGPAREHVPMFIERSDCMIHLCGYAAKETIARELLDTMDSDTIKIWSNVYKKRATVKTTREFSSHATSDKLLQFVNKFKNVRFVVVNHGSVDAAEKFKESILDDCPFVENAGRIDRQTMYCFVQRTPRGVKYSDIFVKAMPAKLKRTDESHKRVERREELRKAKKEQSQRVSKKGKKRQSRRR